MKDNNYCTTTASQCSCGQSQDPNGYFDGSHLQVNTVDHAHIKKS